MRVRVSLTALGVVLLASCGNDLNVVSKDAAMRGGSMPLLSRGHHGSNDSYSALPPSTAAVQSGLSKPKDKHGMPLYGSSERVRHVRTTAYTCTEDDHIQYGSMNAAGTPLRYTRQVRSAAADWSVYPVGTIFKIKGMDPLFVVDDYGSALTGTATVDLYKPTKAHMNTWGRRNVEIAVVRWGSYERSAEILSKRVHHPHCREMYVGIQRKLGGTVATASR